MLQIYVWNFKDNTDLIGMAFIDTQVYVHNMLPMKNLLLTSDIVKSVQLLRFQVRPIDDYAKDGGKELFTKMPCVLQSNSYRIVKDS